MARGRTDQHYHIVADDGEDDSDATPHEKCQVLCDIVADQIGETVRFTAKGDLYRLWSELSFENPLPEHLPAKYLLATRAERRTFAGTP